LLLERLLRLVEQPHILDGDHGLIGESLDQLDLLVGERLDFELVEDHHADDVVAPEHRNAKLGADGMGVSQRVTVLRIRLEVCDMNRSSLERDSARNAVASWRDRMVLDEIDEVSGDVVEGRPMIRLAVPSHNDATS